MSLDHFVRVLVAVGIFVSSLAAALPDGAPGSPRAVALAVGIGMIGAGVYLGAPKPEPQEAS